MLSAEDHKRIEAAIETIERKTSGDIYCIVAHDASHYREVPLAWAAIAALLFLPIALAAGMDPRSLERLVEGWSAAQAAGLERQMSLALLLWVLAQAAVFAAVALILSIEAVRRFVTPGFLKRHRVVSMAQQHFAATGLHLGGGAPHVLIFVALAERRVELIAAEALHKVAGENVWRDATLALSNGMRAPDPTAGIIRAIEIAGQPLIDHFPATGASQPHGGVAEI